jgi:hypothetical protein
MMLPPVALLALAALSSWTGGCRSSVAGADASGDSGDAGADDTGADAPASDGGDGGCNQLSQIGLAVTATCATGAPPAALGGAIVDGTYVLTGTVLYGVCALPDLAETLVVSQGTVESLATSADGTATRRSLTYVIPAAGTVLTETQTCPSRVIASVRFSATPTTLTIYLTNALTTRVSTFTRQ